MFIDDPQLTAIARKYNLRLVVLFGSQATGHPPPGPESDHDVAVLGCPRDAYWDCYGELANLFDGAPLDLVRLEGADPLFRQEVMHQGIRLYGDPNLFCEFRAYAYRDYVDSQDLFDLEYILFRKKMAYLRDELGDSP